MAFAPIPQGTLNRLRGAIQFASFPQLNVTAANLGEAGMTAAFNGDTVMMIPTLTGIVTSPELFVMVQITIPLLKTQGLADQFKAQIESLATVGDVVVFTESSTLGTFKLTNCALSKVEGFPINGKDAVVPYTLTGAWLINSQLFQI